MTGSSRMRSIKARRFLKISEVHHMDLFRSSSSQMKSFKKIKMIENHGAQDFTMSSCKGKMRYSHLNANTSENVPFFQMAAQLCKALVNSEEAWQSPLMEIRNIAAADVPALLALNNTEAERVNALTGEAIDALLRNASAARMTADGTGFLIAFDHTTPPQGPNHTWFITREPRFTYIDRVVVAPAARGRGVARALYEDLTRIARSGGLGLLVCEVNLHPPNPESLAFHERLGFTAMGEAVDPRNGKRVQYMRKPI